MSTCPMSWWPFKKSPAPTATFISLLPQLENMYPIYPSTELSLPWMAESEREGQSRLKNYSRHRQGGITAKCSGIVGLHQRGWIVPAWCDLVIETNGDGHSFQSRTALPDSTFASLPNGANARPVGMFPANVYGDLPSTALPANTLKTIIKIHLPWVFYMPPGWGLLTLPLEYVKEPRFTAAIGVINPRISQQINPVLYWHVLKGQTLIKAGTPLMRMIPIALTQKWTTVVRGATGEEREAYVAQRLFASSTYRRPHGALGRFYDRVQSKLKR